MYKCAGNFHPSSAHEATEVEYNSTLSLTLVLDEGGWSTPHPGHFTHPPPLGIETRYPLYRRMCGPQGKWKGEEDLAPHRDLIPGPSSP
jgi:hypothetical protein